MAMIGFVILILSASVYLNLAYQNQRNAITELIGLKVTNILEELSEISKNLGLNLQTDRKLRAAIRNHDLAPFRKSWITSSTVTSSHREC